MKTGNGGWVQVDRVMWPRDKSRREAIAKIPFHELDEDDRWKGLNESLLVGYKVDAQALTRRALTDTNVPRDVDLVGAWWDLQYGVLCLMLSHPSFAPCPPGEQLPTIDVSVTTFSAHDSVPLYGPSPLQKAYSTWQSLGKPWIDPVVTVKNTMRVPLPKGWPVEAPDTEEIKAACDKIGKAWAKRWEEMASERIFARPGTTRGVPVFNTLFNELERKCHACAQPKVPGGKCECGA